MKDSLKYIKYIPILNYIFWLRERRHWNLFSMEEKKQFLVIGLAAKVSTFLVIFGSGLIIFGILYFW